jgi:hypothetical protein
VQSQLKYISPILIVLNTTNCSGYFKKNSPTPLVGVRFCEVSTAATSLKIGTQIPDRINLIYTDAPLALSVDFALVARYAHQLRRVASETLREEAVMVAVEQMYHVV